VEQAAAQHRIRLHLALEVDSVPLTKAMVQGGLGSTILTLAGVARELATGQLSVRPIHRPPLHSVIAIGQQQSSRGSLVSSTAAVTREVIGALVASGAWPGARLLGVAAHAVSPPPAPLRRRTA
jgi:LysR family nitrogen assimilation transcriptional regulator